MLQTYTEPFPVMTVIEFQVCFVFPFRSLTVHDITVEDRHGVVFIYKPWFPTLSVCLFPQIQPCFIRGYCSQRMLDGRSAQIGRHLWEPDIKIKTGMVFLRSMYQMFCSIKTPLCIRDFC
jgi:hypothetical protein